MVLGSRSKQARQGKGGRRDNTHGSVAVSEGAGKEADALLWTGRRSGSRGEEEEQGSSREKRAGDVERERERVRAAKKRAGVRRRRKEEEQEEEEEVQEEESRCR